MSRRLFVALAPPDGVRERLRAVRESLEAGLPDGAVRWQAPADAHLTLAFLGAVEEGRVDRVAALVRGAAARSAPFGLATDGVGAFPTPRRPSVLWLGVTGDLDLLDRLHRALVHDLGAALDLDARPFRPHLTLGRARRGAEGVALRRAVAEAAAEAADAAPDAPDAPTAWPVREVALIESRLGPEGARYRAIAVAPLEGRRAPRTSVPTADC